MGGLTYRSIKRSGLLLLLKGSIGKRGAGTCPVRGHSNVQGDRTMGIWEKPKEAFLDKLKENFDFEPPRKHGYDAVAAIKAMSEEKAKVFFGLKSSLLFYFLLLVAFMPNIIWQKKG